MDKKVFSVYLGDPDRSNHAELDLPATPWELIDALDKLRLVDGREPYWQVEDIGRYGFLAPLLDDSDLYQFNALAEQLSTFDHVEAIAFEGLVQMEVDELCQTNGGELTLQRLLDLAYSVDGCHVVPGIRDDAALGRFYVENEFLPELEQVPDSVLELLDYAKIGERMRRDEHGAMTPNGYVVREAELRQAPPNLGRPPRKPPYMIRFLCASDTCAMRLDLPTTQTRLNAVLDALGVDSWQEVQLEECDTAMPEMWAFVDMAHTSMEQVNQFAQCLEMLDANGELAAFKAVASQLDIYKLEDAMALAEHLSEYAFEPSSLIRQITDAMETEIIPFPGGTMSLGDIERRLRELEQQFQTLLEKAADDPAAYGGQFKEILDEQTLLKERRSGILADNKEQAKANQRIMDAAQTLKNASPHITEWDESAVRQLVEIVKVLSKDEIAVTLKGGIEICQKIMY